MPGCGGGTTAAGYRAGVAQQPYSKWEAHRHDEIEVDYKQLDDSGRPPLLSSSACFNGRKGTVLKVLLLIVTLCIGLILGYVLRRSVREYVLTGGHCAYTDGYQGYSADVSVKLKELIHAEHIEQNLRNYTKEHHMTGTHGNNVLRDTLKRQFLSFPGIDAVKLTPYNVTLSFPDWERPNTIYLLDQNNTEMYKSAFDGPDSYKQHPELMYAYNAFSPNGTVTGDLVYAGFGELAHFQQLEMHGVNVTGSIVLMRLGRLYKGHMVENAARHGAVGAILFADPAEVVGTTTHLDKGVYPAQWWLPGWGVQRGTVLPSVSGDPATPGLPSTPNMYRERQMKLAKIPVQPIGYGHAADIMINMTGLSLPDTHGAHLSQVEYRSGPGYDGPRKGWKVKLEVNNELMNGVITNVIGTIKGKEEPDRYVIVGCHYDAWTFGAVDPGSGTAILMELAKAFSELRMHSWHPRRTIMFVHWDAEEQALMGSYEFVEQYHKDLADKTVAYINLDVAVRGNYSLDVQASPLMRQLMMNVSKMFPSATSDQPLYDEWRQRTPEPNAQNEDPEDLPQIIPIGGGSDQAAFVYMLGVPAIWPRYMYKSRKDHIRSVPAYHTSMDDFNYMKQFIDPQFKAHESLAWAVGELVLQVSSYTKLPFDIRELARTLEELTDGMQVMLVERSGLKEKQLAPLVEAVQAFSVAAAEFYDRFVGVEITNVLETRAYNDKLIRASQAFIHPEGLPGRPMFKNILFAPSAVSGNTCRTFTGICDSFSPIVDANTAEEREKLLPQLLRQISIATLAVQSATNILSDELLKPSE